MHRDFIKCAKCDKYHWKGAECQKVFYFKYDDWGDEFEEIRAYSFEDAAEEFAKMYHECSDYSLVGSDQEVIISDGKEEIMFSVSAEHEIVYYVKQLE